jgi:GGDEF domain-containing protein
LHGDGFRQLFISVPTGKGIAQALGNEGHGWVVGDKMLKESVRSLRNFVIDGEELYRLDGAHFAIVGSMDNNMARQRAADMRRQLSRASVQVDKTQLPLVVQYWRGDGRPLAGGVGQ